MKIYEKPRLMALSLSGNNQLCGSCTSRGGIAISKDPEGSWALIIDFLAGNDDGIVTREEAERAFGPDEDCKVPIESYCKFGSADFGKQIVAWS